MKKCLFLACVLLMSVYNMAQEHTFPDGYCIFCEYDNAEVVTGSSRKYNQVLSIDRQTIGYVNYRCGVKNEKDEIVIPAEYILIIRYDDQFMVSTNKKSGLISKEGHFMTSIKYNYFHPYNDDYFKVEYKNKMGLIDRNGNEVIPCTYDYIENDMGTNRVKVSNGNRWGLYSLIGKQLLPCTYSVIEAKDYGYRVSKGEKWGVLNNDFHQVVPCNYFILWEVDQYLLAEKGGKQGLLAKDGSVLVPLEYDYLQQIDKNLFRAGRNGFVGIINEKNQTLIDFKYAYINNFIDGVAKTCEGEIVDLRSDKQIDKYRKKGYEVVETPHFVLRMVKDPVYGQISIDDIRKMAGEELVQKN